MLVALVLAALPLLAVAGPAQTARAAPAAAPALARPAVLERVAVVGASVSAGFGLQAEAGRRIGLGDVLGAALLDPPAEIAASASVWTYLDPEGRSQRGIETLLATQPTVLFGVDFLFWFAYGDRESVEAHLARFEKGLALLDRFPCPIVVGDLPDMTSATQVKTPMLRPDMVPPADALKAMNARLAAWAAERPRVCVLPLADFVRRMGSGERIELRGNAWEQDAVARMMQRDMLHPSLEGTAAVALIALDALVRAGALDASAVRWDVAGVLAELVPKPEPAGAEAGADARERGRVR